MFFGFLGGALTWSGNSLVGPRYPSSTLAFTAGRLRNRPVMPSVRTAVWSCTRQQSIAATTVVGPTQPTDRNRESRVYFTA